MAREIGYPVHTKSSLMVGLGETRDELTEAFEALRAADVDILTVGQYLRPSLKHLPLERYYHPDEFAEMKVEALALGFKHVESAPLVRSSYHARDQVPGRRAQAAAPRGHARRRGPGRPARRLIAVAGVPASPAETVAAPFGVPGAMSVPRSRRRRRPFASGACRIAHRRAAPAVGLRRADHHGQPVGRHRCHECPGEPSAGPTATAGRRPRPATRPWPRVPTACYGLDDEDCRRVRDHVATLLTADDPPVALRPGRAVRLPRRRGLPDDPRGQAGGRRHARVRRRAP